MKQNQKLSANLRVLRVSAFEESAPTSTQRRGERRGPQRWLLSAFCFLLSALAVVAQNPSVFQPVRPGAGAGGGINFTNFSSTDFTTNGGVIHVKQPPPPGYLGTNSLNPTLGRIPYKASNTNFGDSPFYFISANRLGFDSTTRDFWISTVTDGNWESLALGVNSQTNTGSGQSTTIGFNAGRDMGNNIGDTGGETALGWKALNTLTNGYSNTAIGAEALASWNQGRDNTAVGSVAGRALRPGASYNSFFGSTAGYGGATSSGSSNTFLGYSSGNNWAGSFNTFIGAGTGESLTRATTNLTLIGHKTTATNDNQVVLGNSAVMAIRGSVSNSYSFGTHTEPAATNFTGAIAFNDGTVQITAAVNGETNTYSSLGASNATVKPLIGTKTGVDLPFRALEQGSNIVLSMTTTSIVVNAVPDGTGTTPNATISYIPYLSGANAFSDSPIFRQDASHVDVGTNHLLFRGSTLTNDVFSDSFGNLTLRRNQTSGNDAITIKGGQVVINAGAATAWTFQTASLSYGQSNSYTFGIASSPASTNFTGAVAFNDGTVQTTAATSSTGANPTSLISLTATNGVATTFLRSDGSQALDTNIAPNWNGIHVFNKSVTNIASSTTAVPLTIDTPAFPVTNLVEWKTNGVLAAYMKSNGNLALPDGSAAQPSLVFATTDDGTGTGFFRRSATGVGFSANGTEVIDLSSGGLALGGQSLIFGSSITANDINISRDSSGVLRSEAGTTTSPTTNRFMGTRTGTGTSGNIYTNCELVELGYDGAQGWFFLRAQKGSSNGTARPLVLSANGIAADVRINTDHSLLVPASITNQSTVWLPTNNAPITTIAPSGLHSIALGKGWTNDLGARAELMISVKYTDAATGDPSFAYTNTVSGVAFTNSFAFGIAGTMQELVTIADISPSDYGSFTDLSGSGSSVTFINAWWKLK